MPYRCALLSQYVQYCRICTILWEVVSAGGDLEGRWHVGISIERPRGYLRNRFRN
jgi:hypothetical protein